MLSALKVLISNNFSKKILVMDAGPIDILINDFPQECLDKDVSLFLKRNYLSVCQLSAQKISSCKIYQGAIMGKMRRLFLSIPTKHQRTDTFFYVHYLLDTGSPITTLTRRALSAIHNKEYKQEYNENIVFPLNLPYQIGSKLVWVQCSNPDKNSESRPHHNINLLGMDFFDQFQQVNLKQNFKKRIFTVELDNNVSEK